MVNDFTTGKESLPDETPRVLVGLPSSRGSNFIFYDPKDNNRIEEFLAKQQATARATARGKKKTNIRKNKSRNKTKKHHRKIK